MPPDRHQHVARVARFMAEHTTTVTDIDSEESCPVCLEEYDARRRLPLQIKETEGCRHIFCKTCLKKLLRKQPNESKRCPFCRTTWIAVEHDQAPRSVVSQAQHQADVAEILNYLSVLENAVGVCEEEIAVHERERARDKEIISLMGALNSYLKNAWENALELDKKTTGLLVEVLADPTQDFIRRKGRIDELRKLRGWGETRLPGTKEASEDQNESSELSTDVELETQKREVGPRAEDEASEALPSQR